MRKVFRIILLIINLLFVVVFLLSTFAGWIPPSKCIWISMLSYGYFWLLLANVVFVLVWLAMVRKEFLISAIAIAARYTFIPLFIQFGGTATPPEEIAQDDMLSVMSFNVHFFAGNEDCYQTLDSNALETLDMIEAEQPDVVCMLEYRKPTNISVLDSMYAMGYKHSYSLGGLENGWWSGPILFSKYPFNYVGEIAGENKFFVDVVKNRQSIRLFCAHLDSYRLDSIDHAQMEKLKHGDLDSSMNRTYGKFRETILKHEEEWNNDIKPLVEESSLPVVLMGDLNDTPASYVYQNMTKTLTDSYVEKGKGFSNTYHGGMAPSIRIDYILHSRNLEAVAYKRVKFGKSDHYPIIAWLRMTPQEEEPQP